MKVLSKEVIKEKLREELVKANTVIATEIEKFFEGYKGPFENEIKKNFEIAKSKKLPLCQDTGLVEFFVFRGCTVVTEEPIGKILNEAVKEVYETEGYRKSVVDDPLFYRKNTFTNVPSVVHFFDTEDEKIVIKFLVKGGGSENGTFLKMFNPTATKEEITEVLLKHLENVVPNACPPVIVGIGIGGSSDEAILLSKLALFGEESEKLKEYRDWEIELEEKINSLKIGVQALGEGKTVQRVTIKYFPTHIATLPVALSLDCFISRRGNVVIE